MFCDRCGAAVQADQRFCGQCGRQFTSFVAQPAPGRVQEHIRMLGILWIALSTLNVLAGVVLYIIGNALFPHLREFCPLPPDVPTGFLSSLFSIIASLILVKAALGLLAGWGLLHHEPWARILTLVLAFLALLHVPFGTALGIYTLWVLLPAESEREYEQATRTARAV